MPEPMLADEFAARLAQATPRMWVTPLLVALNVGVWLLNVMAGLDPLNPRVDALLDWGANHLPATQAEPWRLVTATFLHGGLMHLAFNMWALWDTGRIAERFYGNGQFVLIYAVAGLAGSIASLFWSARAGVSIGASGAIFGVVGALLAALSIKREKLPPQLAGAMGRSMLAFTGFSLFMGFTSAHIDNAAHVGGLAGGYLMGAMLVPKFDWDAFRRQALPRALGALVVAAAVLLAVWRLLPVQVA